MHYHEHGCMHSHVSCQLMQHQGCVLIFSLQTSDWKFVSLLSFLNVTDLPWPRGLSVSPCRVPCCQLTPCTRRDEHTGWFMDKHFMCWHLEGSRSWLESAVQGCSHFQIHTHFQHRLPSYQINQLVRLEKVKGSYTAVVMSFCASVERLHVYWFQG
jgi:hypothetical protein